MTPSTLDALLGQYEQFGVHLGLERIHQLLHDLGNPHQQVPILHVAGSNGKGSVCAYLSSVLSHAGYRVGRYISPHLVSWCERICIDGQPIASEVLEGLLHQIGQAIRPDRPSPTQFEVITAAAWLYFAQQQVDLAVIEVGLGGRLDATNVCDRPLVTIITSISREHWQRLGPTLADIAGEKAGILKTDTPAVIGPLPPEAEAIVQCKIAEVDCSAVWPEPASLTGDWEIHQGRPLPIVQSQDISYPLALAGDFQLTNSALAIAAIKALRQQGWVISDAAIFSGMANTQWPGRIQMTTWNEHHLLIDGAHNPAAAQVLRQTLDNPLWWQKGQSGSPVHWVMGMLSTKDHGDIFQALLRSGDFLYLVPVPGHRSADPTKLASLAWEICPDLNHCQAYPDLWAGLEAARQSHTARKQARPRPIVLCGSLYLLGYFLEKRSA
ncbi:MAG: folylpolyglutamate synthase/dihydrofolate synthase family protein [Leptolyngbyaceae cyanobacterium bins.59]|nr:folylpolyglutamate synthase/dihydrofolate synthase family protein [Leptolyngbyaceae cyanobacterium bins.59]